MKDQHTYDPEDIESLLLHKEFHELYPEERDFVLRHIDTEEEYIEMRNTLLAIQEFSTTQAPPPSSVKENVMAAFHEEYAKKPRFSLNGWLYGLFSFDRQWYRSPALQLGFVLVLVVSAIVFFPNTDESPARLAENIDLKMDSLRNAEEKTGDEEPLEDLNNKEESAQPDEHLIAENRSDLSPAFESATEALAEEEVVVVNMEKTSTEALKDQDDQLTAMENLRDASSEFSPPQPDLRPRTDENMATSNDVIAFDFEDIAEAEDAAPTYTEALSNDAGVTLSATPEITSKSISEISSAEYLSDDVQIQEVTTIADPVTPYFGNEEKNLPSLEPMLDANKNRKLMNVLYSTY